MGLNRYKTWRFLSISKINERGENQYLKYLVSKKMDQLS